MTKMPSIISPLLLATVLLDLVGAINIFVSHYQGTVQTLTLTPQSDGSYSLETNGTVTVGGQPSWMTFDPESRTIYNSDETGWGSGTLTSVSAAADGSLSLSGKATGVAVGGVHNTLYGDGYIAVAH
jgi:6-phosphogluconolactonase (cycloisomerase 2 family)